MLKVRRYFTGHHLDIVSLLAFSATVLFLWLPFGWGVSALTDEWVFLSHVEAGASPVEWFSARPFTVTGLALAHALTPDSFVGLNVLFAALLLSRAFALYLVVSELVPSAKVLATVTGLLYLVFYGDTGWFWLTTFNIGWSALWTLISVWLLLRQLREPRRWMWFAIGVTQYLALSYEGAFPIVLAAPLILPFVEGHINRRVLITAVAWYVVPGLLIARYVYMIVNVAQPYQSGQFSLAMGSEAPIQNMIQSVIRAYRRLLGSAFLDHYTQWRSTLPFLPYAAAIAGIALVTSWYSVRRRPPILHWREVIAAGISGLAIIGLGFASYLVSEFRDVDYRVYYFSAAGAAIFICAAIYGISYGGKLVRRITAGAAVIVALVIAPRLGKLALVMSAVLALFVPAKWLFLLSVTALIGLHASFTLWQHSLYAEAPRGQHWILSDIVLQAPHPADNTLIVLLDESPNRSALNEFENRRDMLIGAVRYLYSNPTLDAAFCVPDADSFGYFNESCAFEDGGYHTAWTKFNLEERTVPYSQVLVFAFDESQGARLLGVLPVTADGYNPLAISGDGQPPPPRAETLLYDFPTGKPDTPVNWSLLH